MWGAAAVCTRGQLRAIKLYLFGGASQKGQVMTDLWVLDLSSRQWSQLQPKGEAASVSNGSMLVCYTASANESVWCCSGLHTVTAAGTKLYVIDGASQKSQMMIDLWFLDLSSMQWSELHPKEEAPHTSHETRTDCYTHFTNKKCVVLQRSAHSDSCWQ